MKKQKLQGHCKSLNQEKVGNSNCISAFIESQKNRCESEHVILNVYNNEPHDSTEF